MREAGGEQLMKSFDKICACAVNSQSEKLENNKIT